MSTITGVYVPINMRKYASAWAQVCHEAEANGKFCGFGLAAGEKWCYNPDDKMEYPHGGAAGGRLFPAVEVRID